MFNKKKKVNYVVIAFDCITNDVFRFEYKSLMSAHLKAEQYRRIYGNECVTLIDKATNTAIECL